jgi:ADP-ribose pyrophosphatase
MSWKVLHSEYLHQKPFLTVRRDHVQLEKGTELEDYYIFESGDFVNTIAITTEGDFVLVRQYRHGLQRTDYELCAGYAEAGEESLLAAAQRELLEETGYSGGQWEQWDALSPNPAITTNWSHTFLATGVTKTTAPHYDAGEEMTVHLCRPEDVKELLRSGKIIQALHAAPLWKYFASQIG